MQWVAGRYSRMLHDISSAVISVRPYPSGPDLLTILCRLQEELDILGPPSPFFSYACTSLPDLVSFLKFHQIYFWEKCQVPR